MKKITPEPLGHIAQLARLKHIKYLLESRHAFELDEFIEKIELKLALLYEIRNERAEFETKLRLISGEGRSVPANSMWN